VIGLKKTFDRAAMALKKSPHLNDTMGDPSLLKETLRRHKAKFIANFNKV
jgi:hypothetical protein